MSGHKRTTIRTNMQNLREYSQAEMSLRFIEAGLDQLSRQLDENSKTERTHQAQRDQVENKRRNEDLSLIDETLGQWDNDFHAALASQQAGIVDTMQQIAEAWGEEHTHQISELKEQYNVDLENLNAWQQESIQPAMDELYGMIESQNDKASYFQQLFSVVEENQRLIEQEPEIEHIFPGVGEQNLQKIYQAYENGQAGFLEAAVTDLNSTYRDLLKIRLDYDVFRTHYDENIRIASLELDKLEQEVLLNLQIPGLDLEGRVLPTIIIVDEWIDGAMTHLKRQVQHARKKLYGPASPVKLAELDRLITRKIPKWHQIVGDLVTRARVEVINSQLRMNIANLALEALSTQGYQVEAARYDDADMRRDYCVQMVDIEGSRVMVKVKSDLNQPQAMELDLYASDNNKRTQHEITQRAVELQRSLQRAGLQVGTFEPVREPGVWTPLLRKQRMLEQKHRGGIQVDDGR
jgi:hypothetical protein